jgi:hypothetical protein
MAEYAPQQVKESSNNYFKSKKEFSHQRLYDLVPQQEVCM